MYTAFVVDDDAVILDEIIHSVPWMDNGFEVIGTAVSPFAAVQMIAASTPDVVFTDLRMPELDGVELMRRLVAQGVQCEYVMLSAYGTFTDSRRFFKERGFDYLLKPIDQKEVQFVLEALALRLAQKKPQEVPADAGSSSPAFSYMVEYIQRNFQQKHTLESLSQQFNWGTNYICNLFAKHYNTTLTRYITALRMQHALQLMQETTQSYKSIAAECGYPDYYYFCRVFKAFYGTSPTEYMKNKGSSD